MEHSRALVSMSDMMVSVGILGGEIGIAGPPESVAVGGLVVMRSWELMGARRHWKHFCRFAHFVYIQ